MQENYQNTNKNSHCGCFSKSEKENLSGGFLKPDREILHAVAKTTSMAIESLKDLLSSTEECGCEDTLRCQMECYKEIYREARKALEEIDEDVDKIGGMQKMMLWTATKWDMFKDDTNSHIAEMLIRGTAMGVCEVGKALNDFKDISSVASITIADKTMHLMSEFVDQLKKLL